MTLKIRNLEFSFSRSRFTLDIDELEISSGLTFLIGRNGAGKSTLLNLLTRRLKPNRGFIEGLPLKLGYVPQRPTLPLDFTVHKLLEYCALINGVSPRDSKNAVPYALELLQLEALADHDIKNLSGGMQRRLAIACAAVHRPSLLVLDEPTNDLDPVQRRHLSMVIREISATATVVVSTHFLHGVAMPSDNVILLDQGAVAYSGSAKNFAAAAAVPARDDPALSLEEAMVSRTGTTPT